MNEPRPDPVQRYLRQLPRALPDAALGDAIVQRHLARRRLRRGSSLLAVAAMAAWVLVWPLFRQAPAPEHGAVRTVHDRVSPAWVEIRALDRQLQAAYSTGADADAVAQLWTQRAAMEQRLQAGATVTLQEVSL